MKALFEQDLKVVNIGLQGFANNIAAAGGQVTNLSWSPPAGADAALGWTLANMIGDPRIEQANRTAFERYLAAQPRLVDFVLARDAIPALTERRILGDGGFIAATVVVDSVTGKVVGDATVSARGFSEDPRVFEPVLPLITEALNRAAEDGISDPHQLQQVVRRTVGRWVNETYRRRPMIVPTVVEV